MLRVYKNFFISSVFFLLCGSHVSGNSHYQKISEQDLVSMSTQELMCCVQQLEREPERQVLLDPTVGAPIVVCLAVSICFGLQALWDKCTECYCSDSDEQRED
ncbi:hypothetical protein K2X40_03800 [Candidatus Babeliales bacterium]|nr:hypothetical protein [Candidatus Babeliales bacterium]